MLFLCRKIGLFISMHFPVRMFLATNRRVQPVLLALIINCLFNALISFISFADVHILNIKNWAVRFFYSLFSFRCLSTVMFFSFFFDACFFFFSFCWGGGGGGGLWMVYIAYCNLQI